MKTNNTKPIGLFLCICCFGYAKAQESVNATGGSASGPNGSASYSIGQVVYTTNASGSGSVAQGVQHAYEIFPVGNENTNNVTITTWPNPAADILMVNLGNYNQEKLNYFMHDAAGKLVLSGELNAQQTKINTGQMASAIYFLTIINQQQNSKQSFKIIKNQ